MSFRDDAAAAWDDVRRIMKVSGRGVDAEVVLEAQVRLAQPVVIAEDTASSQGAVLLADGSGLPQGINQVGHDKAVVTERRQVDLPHRLFIARKFFAKLHAWMARTPPVARTLIARKAVTSMKQQGPGLETPVLTWAFILERVTGIEPALSAWEADVLPLNYTRADRHGPVGRACAVFAQTSYRNR